MRADGSYWLVRKGKSVKNHCTADCVCGHSVIQVESMLSLVKQRVAQLQNGTAWQHV